MRTIAQSLFCILLSFSLLACGGGGNDDSTTSLPKPKPDPIPQAVNLIAPPNNSVCVGHEQENTIQVDFEWSSVNYAKDYVITIYNSSGTATNSLETKNTSARLNLPKNSAFTWNVKAKNSSGESISTTFNTTTPGKAVSNSIPTIKSIAFDEAENNIVILVQDTEGDQLFYDAISANNHAFENPTTYASNNEISTSSNNLAEQKIQIGNVQWTVNFWFKFTLRDASGNQIVGIKSQNF